MSGAMASGMLLGAALPPAAGAQEDLFRLDRGADVFGLGVAMFPEYPGSGDPQAGLAPVERSYFSADRPAQLLGPELSLNLLDDEHWQLGPKLVYRIGPDEGPGAPLVQSPDEAEGAIEVGGFAGLSLEQPGEPRHRLSLEADALADPGGARDDWSSSAQLSYFRPLSRSAVLHVGGGLAYGGTGYADTYYGLSPRSLLATGLPRFGADAGTLDYRLTLGGTVNLSPNWQLGAGARYQRPLDDAGEGSAADVGGGSDQWIYGAGVGYSWQ